MNTSRHGKIARLPKVLRDELNRRLQNGQPGRQLVTWLNALPEVQAILAAEFAGKPIREQNVSEWRVGGYRDWLAQQEALELAQRLSEDAVELQVEGRPPLTDTLALWLAARYAVASRSLAAQPAADQWQQLRELCADVVELRRGDHSAERLRLDREQLAVNRQRTEQERVQEFWDWASDPDVRERICRGFMTQAEKLECIGQHLFGDLWRPRRDAPGEPPGSDGQETPPATPAAPSSQGKPDSVNPAEPSCACPA